MVFFVCFCFFFLCFLSVVGLFLLAVVVFFPSVLLVSFFFFLLLILFLLLVFSSLRLLVDLFVFFTFFSSYNVVSQPVSFGLKILPDSSRLNSVGVLSGHASILIASQVGAKMACHCSLACWNR